MKGDSLSMVDEVSVETMFSECSNFLVREISQSRCL